MGFLVLVVGVVIAFLLWRILGAQREQTHAVQVHTATQVAATLVQRLEQGWRDARDRKRLIEWFDQTTRELNVSDDEARFELSRQHNHEIFQFLLAESLERGVRCRWVGEKDYESPGHPGPRPISEPWCNSQCDDSMRIDYIPDGADRCPYCGGGVEFLYSQEETAEEQAKWDAHMLSFNRFALLFPEKAREEQIESETAHAAAAARRLQEYELAIAAKR